MNTTYEKQQAPALKILFALERAREREEGGEFCGEKMEGTSSVFVWKNGELFYLFAYFCEKWDSKEQLRFGGVAKSLSVPIH